MNTALRSVSIFACGAIVASLPWLLTSRPTFGQERAEAPQGYRGNPTQPMPPGQGGQFFPQGGPMVSSVTFHGEYMFVAAGDTVYKVEHKPHNNELMRVISSVRFGIPMQPGRRPDGSPGFGANPPRGGGGGDNESPAVDTNATQGTD